MSFFFFFFETIVESIRWTTGRETEKRSNIFVRTRPVKSFPDIFRYRGRHSLPPDIDRENGIHLHHGVRSNDRAQSPSRTLLPRLLHPTDGRPKLDAIIARSYHFGLERLYIYFDDNSIISLYFNGKGGGQRRLYDEWNRAWMGEGRGSIQPQLVGILLLGWRFNDNSKGHRGHRNRHRSSIPPY